MQNADMYNAYAQMQLPNLENKKKSKQDIQS